jgi:hypothetical protein
LHAPSSSSGSLGSVRGSGYCSARGVARASSTEGPRKRKPPPSLPFPPPLTMRAHLQYLETSKEGTVSPLSALFM